MAKITIYSTRNESKKVVESSATTWGVLKEELSAHYNFSNLQATESVGKTDLVNNSANLPSGNFTIFLRPVKTKSGAYSYSEAREIVKEDSELQKYIKDTYGRNYTNLTTATLNEAIQNMYDDDNDEDEDFDEDFDDEDEEVQFETPTEVYIKSESKIDLLIANIGAFREVLLSYINKSTLSYQAELINLRDSQPEKESKEVDEDIERLKREAREIFGE